MDGFNGINGEQGKANIRDRSERNTTELETKWIKNKERKALKRGENVYADFSQPQHELHV